MGAEARFFLPTNAGSLAGLRLDLTVMELAVLPCARYKWAFGCAFLAPGFTIDSGPITEGPDPYYPVRTAVEEDGLGDEVTVCCAGPNDPE